MTDSNGRHAQSSYDLIVLGGGPAGVTAALRAREFGVSVALVEKGRMGGTCTNDGCVPTRALAKAARLVRESRQLAEFGITGSEPRIYFPALLRSVQETVERVHEKKQIVEHLERVGVDVWAEAGAARFVDPHTVELGNGQRLHGEKFLICVGGRARRLDFPGSEHALTHSDVWRMTRLPRSVAIVGAAATGCQLASILQTFGSQVHLLEVAPRILPGEDRALSVAVEDAFRRQGMGIAAGLAAVERIEKLDSSYCLYYRTQDETHSLFAEEIILAVGWIGNSDTLNLAAAGVQQERSYIVVDNHLRTTAPHIFAAGDVTGRMMLVQSGSYEARVAVENAILNADQDYTHHIVPHGSFTDPEYGSVGMSEETASQHWSVRSVTVPYSDLDRAIIDRQPYGFCKLVVREEDRTVVGAHVVGEGATEVVQLIAAGMTSGLEVGQLARLEMAYPTYSAIVGLAARRLVHEMGLANGDLHLGPQWRALSKDHIAEWERSG